MIFRQPIGAFIVALLALGGSHPVVSDSPPLLELRLMSHPRGAPPGSLDPVPPIWSQHDYDDTLFVEAVIAGGPLHRGGSVVGSVEYRVARIDRNSPTGGVTAGAWLPSTQVFHALVGQSASEPERLRLGVISPGSALKALQEADPDVEFVSVRVRLFLVTPGVGAYGVRQRAQRTVELAMAD